MTMAPTTATSPSNALLTKRDARRGTEITCKAELISRVGSRAASAKLDPISDDNPNVDWLSFRGTWLTNLLIVGALKVLFSSVPGITTELSWTLTNLTYNIVRIEGTAFDCNSSFYSSSSTGSLAPRLT